VTLVETTPQEQSKAHAAQSAMDRRPERLDRMDRIDRPSRKSKDPKPLDDSTPGTGFEPLGVAAAL
jgi:hypothetical protein